MCWLMRVRRDVVGAGRGDRPQLLDGRETDRHRAGERHREKREEIPLRLDQLDRQRVARRDDARDLGRLPVRCTRLAPTMFVKNWLRRRGHVVAERALEGVLHALSGDEAVRRWRELRSRCGSGTCTSSGRQRSSASPLRSPASGATPHARPRSVGVVDELRAGRVLEFPGGRDVRECRIDLHRLHRSCRLETCPSGGVFGEAETEAAVANASAARPRNRERYEPSGLLWALHVSPPLTRAN